MPIWCPSLAFALKIWWSQPNPIEPLSPMQINQWSSLSAPPLAPRDPRTTSSGKKWVQIPTPSGLGPAGNGLSTRLMALQGSSEDYLFGARSWLWRLTVYLWWELSVPQHSENGGLAQRDWVP